MASSKYGERLSSNFPRNLEEAIQSSFAKEWKEAMKEEISSLVENETWEVVPKPKMKLISTKWVFTVRLRENEEFAKARLVARGFKDYHRYGATEIYSPVILAVTFRWIIFLANRLDFELIQMDIKTAFLYGKINHEIFLSIHKGLNYDKEKYALRLKRSISGLKLGSKD